MRKIILLPTLLAFLLVATVTFATQEDKLHWLILLQQLKP
jgi:hypothetical protein